MALVKQQKVVSLVEAKQMKALRQVLANFDHIESSCPLRDYLTGVRSTYNREPNCTYNVNLDKCLGCPTARHWIGNHIESAAFIAKNVEDRRYIALARLYESLFGVFEQGVGKNDLSI